MHPRNLHLYFFSPTGGTQRVAGLFAENLNAADACTDITVHAEAKTFSADDCLLVFFPVYGGRVPGPCLARMRALRGTDTPAVLVAVFGNRAVDDALLEMRDTLTPLGFRVIAAAEVIAPHSVNTDIAAGRPDTSDRSKIKDFCTRLAARIAADAPAEIAGPGCAASAAACARTTAPPARSRRPRRRRWTSISASPVCAASRSARSRPAACRCRCGWPRPPR